MAQSKELSELRRKEPTPITSSKYVGCNEYEKYGMAWR